MTSESGAVDASLKTGISVVVPVYQSTESLVRLVTQVELVLAPLGPFEVILVDDGSAPASWGTINEISQSRGFVRGARLGRNYGQHAATLAGLRMASFSTAITMDDDLQQSPADIPLLVTGLNEMQADVVYGRSPVHETSYLRRASSSGIRWILGRLLGVSQAPQLSSFRAIRTELREAFAFELGPNIQIDALLAWSTDRFGSVAVEHNARAYGRSGHSLWRLAKFALDSVTGYSVIPLQLASALGLVTAFVGLVLLTYATVPVLLGWGSLPGFPFLAGALSIFSGVQLLAIGIIGEYIARMHFRVMRKPTYFVASKTK